MKSKQIKLKTEHGVPFNDYKIKVHNSSIKSSLLKGWVG